MAEEYCWATTQAAGRSCYGRSGSVIFEFGFHLDSVVVCVYTGLFEMIVEVLTVIHNTLETGVYVFFYLIEQHSKFLLHTVQVLYMCTLCDSTNISTNLNIPMNHFE